VIFILTGPIHSGKTTLIKKTAQKLKQGGLEIDGFLSESRWRDKEIFGYDLLDLGNGKSYPFIRRTGKKDWERQGPFYFLPETMTLAKKIIGRIQNTDICVIDEVGPLEMSGKGLWPPLKKSLSINRFHHLLVIRISILEKFLSRIHRKDVRLFGVEEKNTSVEMFKSLMSEQSRSRGS
jgi:nucleoside-triphosphatase THEP1